MNEAFEALINRLVGSDETNAGDQLVQRDGAFFNDGENEGDEDGEATWIDGKMSGEEIGEAILWVSASGFVLRRKNRTGADFPLLPQTFDP